LELEEGIGLMLIKRVFPILVVISLVGGCICKVGKPKATLTPPRVIALTPTPAIPPAPIPGHPAPDFALPDLEGNEVRLSDLRGKVVLLNFWATWCSYCRRFLPILSTAHEELKEKGFIVVAVDVREEMSRVRAYIEENELSFLTVLDRKGSTARLYRIRGLPTSFFIDQEGIVQGIYIGLMDLTTIRRIVEGLI
jgi:thiol-disulfide isomerase/thioredoxin